MAEGIVIEDVGGSFARLHQQGPKLARQLLAGAVKTTAFALAQRMRAKAPVGPDAPHIKDAVTYTARGLSAQVGYINATQTAAPGSTASIADVALYNEFRPNEQPFMRPSAEAESSDYVRRIRDAIRQWEGQLGGFGSGLR